MNRLALIALFVFWCLSASAQTVVRHGYDNTGNRTSRGVTTNAAAPQWSFTGTTRCAVNSNSINTGFIERQEKDVNAASATYNTTRWVLGGYNAATCPQPANWVATGNYRCELDGSGYNTGYEEEEQIDNNPGSATYNQTQWVLGYYNTNSCPLPDLCDYYNCGVNGDEYRCVYGTCELGYKVYTSYYYDYYYAKYICTYHFEWSDGYWSPDYTEENYYSPCY